MVFTGRHAATWDLWGCNLPLFVCTVALVCIVLHLYSSSHVSIVKLRAPLRGITENAAVPCDYGVQALTCTSAFYSFPLFLCCSVARASLHVEKCGFLLKMSSSASHPNPPLRIERRFCPKLWRKNLRTSLNEDLFPPALGQSGCSNRNIIYMYRPIYTLSTKRHLRSQCGRISDVRTYVVCLLRQRVVSVSKYQVNMHGDSTCSFSPRHNSKIRTISFLLVTLTPSKSMKLKHIYFVQLKKMPCTRYEVIKAL